MKKWITWRVLLALVFVFLTLIGPTRGKQTLAAQSLAAQDPTNLLQNPGFEGNYFPWSGINEVQVAHGWTPWWRKRTDADPPATYFQPEYKQANGYIYPNRVHGGAAAQQWFTFHATHQAGMYQQVFNVTPGARYRFTVWAQVWSSVQDDPNYSIEPAYPNLKVGIDPTGNWNPWDGDVVWSGAYAFYDSWGQLAVEAVARNDVITVFLHSEPNIPVKHNDMYWDDAAVVAVGADVPPPAPPTATSAGPPPATPTCAPAPADWVTYHVQRGDTLYSLARNSGTTLDVVVSVNCLGSTTIHVGQALLLPKLPDTATPAPATSTAVPATATSRPTATTLTEPTATAPFTSTPTQAGATLAPTDLPATSTPTPASVAAASATPASSSPTIPPPSTRTPGSPTPAATPTPLGESTRPCGTIAVGAGIVLVAGGFRWRKRGRSN